MLPREIRNPRGNAVQKYGGRWLRLTHDADDRQRLFNRFSLIGPFGTVSINASAHLGVVLLAGGGEEGDVQGIGA